ncbi:matrixin family metalloprotease [Nitrosopumilus sp.]|uniref:matrixin family metalloprotease n=1 Tax=Nitrosopumilus sp. TaxID=2024843 RepID=UPI00349FE670
MSTSNKFYILDEQIEQLLHEKSILLNQELCKNHEIISSLHKTHQKNTLIDINSNNFDFQTFENEHYSNNLIRKNIKNYKINPVLKKIIITGIILGSSCAIGLQLSSEHHPVSFDTQYLVQNLKGDTIDTWNYWDIPSNRPLYVGIVGSNLINADYYHELENVILSEEKINVDNSILHKGPKGTESVNYLGWSGALKSISEKTIHSIPSTFEILHSDKSQSSGDIIITLTTQKSPDGISGFTTSLLQENQILKSRITIYDVDELSKNQFATILRHEFGHAIGLAHSTAPEDLMYPTITTSIPFISDCNIDAIVSLYNGNKQSEVVCEI